MLRTVEVRWWGEGQVPGDVRAWFQSCPGDSSQQLKRTDYYLHTNDSGIGIKIRDDRLEIKYRTREFGQQRFHSCVIGRVEQWWKVSLGSDQAQFGDNIVDSSELTWLGVSKIRQLRNYQLNNQGLVYPATDVDRKYQDNSATHRTGCSLEVTAVQVGSQEWWTLAFEAAEEEDRGTEILVSIITDLASRNDPPSLFAEDSYCYTDWLAQL